MRYMRLISPTKAASSIETEYVIARALDLDPLGASKRKRGRKKKKKDPFDIW